MVLDAVSNFVRGTADAEVGTDDTTVSVEDASIFPDPATDGEFNVVIWDANNFPRPDQDADVEILRVTARDTDANELTVTRAQEMTSAAAHPEGSAIHLSPTAKMFSDIESTFGDFWDAGTQELTADVNNTNTTTTTLEADKIRTPPTGCLVTLDGNQTVPDDTIVDLEWEVESSRGEASDLLDSSDNVVVVPDGFEFARLNINVFFDDFGDAPHTIDQLTPRKNGSAADEGWRGLQQSEISVRSYQMGTGWEPVNVDDEISVEFRQISGASRELRGGFSLTFMEVWLI